MTESIVSIQHLNHFFGSTRLQKQVLFDINLELKAGEIVLLTGPSGCGKTTLLTLMGALREVQNSRENVQADASLTILGQELRGASRKQLVEVRRHIGYIFQAHNLLNCLTARQNVQMSMELHPQISRTETDAKVTEILEAVGLEDRIDYYPENLSGGQKQRVAIARALVSHPTLVLADEPTAALDSKSGRDVVEIMQHLAKNQGSTILLVTHDHRILDIADRIIKMEDGHLIQDQPQFSEPLVSPATASV
ncbi:MAG: DevA family ABC transporter ATP-binding protein [Microcoleaceae cyanobacterium]